VPQSLSSKHSWVLPLILLVLLGPINRNFINHAIAPAAFCSNNPTNSPGLQLRSQTETVSLDSKLTHYPSFSFVDDLGLKPL